MYQIYCKSFCDSDGDGIGDLRGVISKLPELKDLGIDCIWLNPVYTSPQVDNGYDISDYYDIEPTYGTMADFKELLATAHAENYEDLKRRPVYQPLAKSGLFEQAIILGRDKSWRMERMELCT